MTQSILTVPIDSFRAQVPLIATSQLKSILRGIYAWKSKHLKKDDGYGQEFILILADMERKETIIWNQLQTRGVLTKENSREFQKWLNSNREKRIY